MPVPEGAVGPLSQMPHLSPTHDLLLINLAAIMEAADERLVPAVYRELGEAFGATPSMLGALTFARALIQALSSPLAGLLAMHYDRATVIGLGTVFWALSTLAVGLSTSYYQAVLARAVNGVGLAIVIPAIQSFVADAYESGGRGVAFGWLNLTGAAGGICGSMTATMLAGTTVLGVAGWRFAFFIMAAVSGVVGYLVYTVVVDPKPPPARTEKGAKPVTLTRKVEEAVSGMRTVLRVRTFQLIIAQGVVGSLAWQCFVFFTLWLQLIGFRHNGAATLMGIFSGGNALGALFGGWLGDRAARLSPNSGRIWVAQTSALAGLVWCCVVLLLAPADPHRYGLFAVLLVGMGLTISWCQSGTNNPIFAEIVPRHLRTTVYASDRAFEGMVSALGPPLVGVLAEVVFGYSVAEAIGEESPRNAHALALGLFWCMGPSFALCAALYRPLHSSYKHDRDRTAREQASEEEPHRIL